MKKLNKEMKELGWEKVPHIYGWTQYSDYRCEGKINRTITFNDKRKQVFFNSWVREERTMYLDMEVNNVIQKILKHKKWIGEDE